MARLLQTCHSESPSWAVLSRTQGPVNSPNIQSHRPVSPAMLFKHLLKLTVLQCQQPENDPSGTATALYAQWNVNADKKGGVAVEGKPECMWEREALESGITSYRVCRAPARLLLLSASWRIWLRDTPTQLRAIQPNRSYAPDLLSKTPKLDNQEPGRRA